MMARDDRVGFQVRRLALPVMLALSTPAQAETAPAAPTAAVQAEAPAELVSALVEHLRVADMLVGLKQAMLKLNLFDGAGDTLTAMKRAGLKTNPIDGVVGDEKAQKKLSAAWVATVNNALDVDKILASIRADIARSFSASDLEWHRNFYRSELGQTLIRLERYRFAEVDLQPDAAQSMADGLLQLEQMQQELDADSARAAALNRLVAATGGEDAYIDAMMSIATGLGEAALAAAPPGEPAAKVEALIRSADQYRPMLSVLVQPMIVPALAKYYEPLATRDIDAFAMAMETPEGKRMTSGLAKLTGRTVVTLVKDFGTELARQSKSEPQ